MYAFGLLQAEYSLIRPVLIQNSFLIIHEKRATTFSQSLYHNFIRNYLFQFFFKYNFWFILGDFETIVITALKENINNPTSELYKVILEK